MNNDQIGSLRNVVDQWKVSYVGAQRVQKARLIYDRRCSKYDAIQMIKKEVGLSEELAEKLVASFYEDDCYVASGDKFMTEYVDLERNNPLASMEVGTDPKTFIMFVEENATKKFVEYATLKYTNPDVAEEIRKSIEIAYNSHADDRRKRDERDARFVFLLKFGFYSIVAIVIILLLSFG